MVTYSSPASVTGGAPPVITENCLTIALKTVRCVCFQMKHIGIENHTQA